MLGLILFVFGHLLMSLFFYCNHRFIFHGKLGKLPLLRSWRRVHTNHHRDYFGSDKKKAVGLLPIWGWGLFIAACFSFGFLNPWLAAGLFSYVITYEIAHSMAHLDPKRFRWTWMHHLHHHKNVKKNFASIYVFWDKMFRTDVFIERDSSLRIQE